MEYRKKPIVIDAEIAEVSGVIETAEGDMEYEPGDYIITGVKGERYPCKPDIFAMTFENVDNLGGITKAEYDLQQAEDMHSRFHAAVAGVRDEIEKLAAKMDSTGDEPPQPESYDIQAFADRLTAALSAAPTGAPDANPCTTCGHIHDGPINNECKYYADTLSAAPARDAVVANDKCVKCGKVLNADDAVADIGNPEDGELCCSDCHEVMFPLNTPPPPVSGIDPAAVAKWRDEYDTRAEHAKKLADLGDNVSMNTARDGVYRVVVEDLTALINGAGEQEPVVPLSLFTKLRGACLDVETDDGMRRDLHESLSTLFELIHSNEVRQAFIDIHNRRAPSPVSDLLHSAYRHSSPTEHIQGSRATDPEAATPCKTCGECGWNLPDTFQGEQAESPKRCNMADDITACPAFVRRAKESE